MPLHAASEAGHAEVVRLLLDKNADIMVAQKHACTPLFLAAINGCADVVKSFLGHYKAEAASQGSHGRKALFCAARFGRHEVVQLLLATG
jgi:ankyrin repeat protein